MILLITATNNLLLMGALEYNDYKSITGNEKPLACLDHNYLITEKSLACLDNNYLITETYGSIKKQIGLVAVTFVGL